MRSKGLQAKDLVSARAIAVHLDMEVDEFAQMFERSDISAAVVLDERGRVLGLVRAEDAHGFLAWRRSHR
jgi:Mg/Co/Ni transporter MgtE